MDSPYPQPPTAGQGLSSLSPIHTAPFFIHRLSTPTHTLSTDLGRSYAHGRARAVALSSAVACATRGAKAASHNRETHAAGQRGRLSLGVVVGPAIIAALSFDRPRALPPAWSRAITGMRAGSAGLSVALAGATRRLLEGWTARERDLFSCSPPPGIVRWNCGNSTPPTTTAYPARHVDGYVLRPRYD